MVLYLARECTEYVADPKSFAASAIASVAKKTPKSLSRFLHNAGKMVAEFFKGTTGETLFLTG